MEQVYLLELHGKLATLNPNPTAKVSLRWINEVDQYKWYIGSNGYPFTFIKGSRIQLHRFIHYLIKGYWTELIVDHINRNKFDATDSNLREATAAENSYNKTFSNPNHNIKYNQSKCKYEVLIQKNKVNHKIANIETLEEARNIYKLMAEELFGEFAPI
jgi:hypothetical protein